MKVYPLIILLILSLPMQLIAQRDTVKIQKVDIVKSKIQLQDPHSARNIEVITRQQIEQLPVKTLQELLSYVGGIDLRQRGPFGSQADISIDGGSFEQTLVLLNGIKMTDAQTAHNMLNIPVPLDAIERIEILKGPAARVYGINSLTGAINIVTLSTDQRFLAVNAYGGSSFQPKEAGDGKGLYGGGGLQLTANYAKEKQRHLLAISQDIYNGQRYNSAQNNTRLFYTGKYTLRPNHTLHWLGSYTHNSFGANGFYAAPGDRNSQEIVQTALFNVGSTHQWKNFKLRTNVSNRYTDDDYRYFKDQLDKARSRHYSNAFSFELKANYLTSFGTFGLGYEVRMEQINSSNIGKHQRENQGVYADYKHLLWKKLNTNIGAYVNYNSNFGWQVYPGVDLAYLFLPRWKLNVSAGSGQRIPSFTDLYLNQKPGNVGNPDLKPETAWQYDASIHYTYKTLKVKASYFYRNIDQFIDWVRDSVSQPYSPVNFGQNQIQGINASIQQTFRFKNEQHISYQMSYNYLKPNLKTANTFSKYVLESLRHQIIIGINYGIKDFQIGVNGRYIERELNDPYLLLDLRASMKIKAFQIYFDLSNLLQTRYKEAGAVPMPPRWFSLGLRYKLA